MNPQEFPWEDSEKNIYEFEKLLRSLKKDIKPGSPLETELLHVMEIYKIHKGEINYDPSVDYRKTFRRVVGLNDILRKILIRSRNPLFDKIKRHLPLLLKAANVSLSDSSMQNDDENNKLLELYIALAVMGFAIDLELDHPKKSSGGTNPDIIFDYQNSRWAIACKSLHSEQTTRLRSQIEDGVSQIDSSDAQKGIVIVKITNLIDHDKAWGINIKDGIVYYDYYEENITKQHFYNMAQDVACRLASVLQENDIELIFGNSKAIPYVLGFFSTVTGLTRNGSNQTVLLRLLYPVVNKEVDETTASVLEMINKGLHDQI